ncbi:MAG: hypothetical protein ABI615_00465 [Chthoniobacterales bacterium]
MNQTPNPETVRRKWYLRWPIIALAILLVVSPPSLWMTLHHLTTITNWSVSKIAPNPHIRFENVTLENLRTTHIGRISVYSRDQNKLLIEAKDVTVTAHLTELVKNHFRKIDIKELTINITEEFEDAFKDADAKPTNNQSIWKIDNLECNYGVIDVQEAGERPFHYNAKFFLALKDVGTSPDVIKNLQYITTWDGRVNISSDLPMLDLDLVMVGLSLDKLKEKYVQEVTISGGKFIFGTSLRKTLADRQSTEPAKDTDAATWLLGKLTIENITAKIADLGTSIPDIQFTIQTELYNLSAAAATDELSTSMQQVKISDLNVYSPLDPFVRVMSLRNISVRFSLRGMLNKRIDDILIMNPALYIREDLFWYMESAESDKKKNLEEAAQNKEEPWIVNTFTAAFGKIIFALGGTQEMDLPWGFEADAKNVPLSDIAALRQLHVSINPPEVYKNPDYQIELRQIKADIHLAYPADSSQNNLVPDIRIEEAQWRGYQSEKLWLSVNFDKNGIDGRFGGDAYNGKIGGGFSFFFQESSPWFAWLYGRRVNLSQFTDAFAPQNIQMTGALNFDIQVDSQKKLIRRMKGNFRTLRPGHLKITKIDELLKRIPPEWSSFKQSSTRIALETFRDFDYTKGTGDFWFVDSQGILKLNLTGPTGTRNVEIVLHSGEGSAGRWQEKEKSSP